MRRDPHCRNPRQALPPDADGCILNRMTDRELPASRNEHLPLGLVAGLRCEGLAQEGNSPLLSSLHAEVLENGSTTIASRGVLRHNEGEGAHRRSGKEQP